MNIRRGFFRLWLLLSFSFAVVVVIAFADDLRTQISFERLLSPSAFDPDAYLAGREPQNPWGLLAKMAGIVITAPLAVLVLGRALLWVVEGFRGMPRNSN